MEQDPRIDAYIEKAAPFARPILTHLRALVHEALPDLGETIKWGMPHFTVAGKNLAGIAAFKAHCAFVIHGTGRQGMERDPGMGDYGKIASLDDLPPAEELKTKLLAAAEKIRQGGGMARPKKAPKEAIPMPEDFTQALKAHPAAQAVFEGFAPSNRRDYLEWIVEAKQAATRAKRIAQAVEWLAEGKKRNWKYEKC
ncbi:YdeI/OmpD-associated family protein [Novosphingobium rosa]|uniref:YdeI/OmpD-associated family protein n=1 Tax=Novosphingobium rosa TaxID=76978 RepID=UPI00082BBB98|nr:YdeI/OmpD-associated family protein [Novosphingobium rosa]